MAGWSRRDAVGFAVGAFATIAILVNVLFMQAGPHPAPMFKATSVAVKAPAPETPVVPRPRPVVEQQPTTASPPKPPAPARTPGEIITDIQRELARRGYYEGTIDGLYGPRTDAAIRDFEQAASLKPSTEPNEALVQAISRAPAKASKTAAAPGPAAAPVPAAARPPVPVRNDVVPERPVPSRRVVALQRALAEYGYGQLKPSGLVDADTQAAIEKFERERRLPVTGQPSDRVMRELSAMTGRPLE